MGTMRKFTNGYTKSLTDEEALKIANSVMKNDWFYLKDYYSGQQKVFFPFSSDEHDTRILVVDRGSQKRFIKDPKEVLSEMREATRIKLSDLSDKLYEWG